MDNLQALLSQVTWSDEFTEAVYEYNRGLLHLGELREAVVAEMGRDHTPAEMDVFAAVLEDMDADLDECAGINMLYDQTYNMVYHTSSRTLVPWWMYA